MRPKPRKASEHHGAFGRMRLQFDGILTRDNGARHHRFVFNCHQGYRWQYTALGKIRTHLAAAGYEEVAADPPVEKPARMEHLIRVFRRGEDEVRVDTFTTFADEECVRRVDHYEDGTAGDGRNRLSIGDVINAMSWGMARA